MKASKKRQLELEARINSVAPLEAFDMQQQGAVLIDVREPEEIAAGSPVDSIRMSRAYFEFEIEDEVADKDAKVLLMCASGLRSLFVADEMLRMGYTDVSNVTGGFVQWKNDGIGFEMPRMLDAEGRERYSRHLLMPEVGEIGQQKLLDAKVLMIGAGGLGSPAAYYLAAAGVGQIGIVDDDIVDRSNLQRQILHTEANIGKPKVTSARMALEALNPSVKVVEFETRLTSDNVEDIFKGYHLIVDGSDNFATRYLVNDACVKHNLPNIHGAVYRFEGQVTVFWPGYAKRRGPCYRCLYPEPPPPDMAPSCAEAGVLGILPGVVGMLEAVEAIKIILDLGDPLVGKLLHYDALHARFSEFKQRHDPDCPYCGDNVKEFPGYIDYATFCAAPVA